MTAATNLSLYHNEIAVSEDLQLLPGAAWVILTETYVVSGAECHALNPKTSHRIPKAQPAHILLLGGQTLPYETLTMSPKPQRLTLSPKP